MPLDKLSIIVPVYNVEKYIEKCIQSLLNQTYKNIQIILIDDGSTDSSGKICDRYAEKDSRIKVIHKENGGLSSARNAGICVADGDYITFVDGDDFVHQETYELLMKKITESQATIIKMAFNRVNENESLSSEHANFDCTIRKIRNEEYIQGICTYKASCSFCDKVFKKEAFDNYKFTQGKNNEDLLLLMTMLLREKYDIYEVDFKGYNYLIRSDSITTTKFGKTITDTVYNCLELQELSNKERPEFSNVIRELLLYQIRTFLILMPKEYITDKNEHYILVYNLLKENKHYIKTAFFSNKDKIFLNMCILNIGLTKKLIGLKSF